jgi:hypothetical protein
LVLYFRCPQEMDGVFNFLRAVAIERIHYHTTVPEASRDWTYRAAAAKDVRERDSRIRPDLRNVLRAAAMARQLAIAAMPARKREPFDGFREAEDRVAG